MTALAFLIVAASLSTTDRKLLADLLVMCHTQQAAMLPGAEAADLGLSASNDDKVLTEEDALAIPCAQVGEGREGEMAGGGWWSRLLSECDDCTAVYLVVLTLEDPPEPRHC